MISEFKTTTVKEEAEQEIDETEDERQMVDNNIKNKLRRNRQRQRVYAIEIDDDNADTVDLDNGITITAKGENA